MFTVPLFDQPATVERARIEGGKIVHLLEPEYHDDHLSGLGKVLCFRNYGHDIVERLKTAGFSSARLDFSFTRSYMGYGRPIVIARK
ncbi:hypothetical protein [Parahaliea mediterranea]|uniref:Uncharacterized protein n=1 Tax=Parahaliea mediterranea TaxID=651086 RepID=A0A939DGL4_9GAMM|nr:hypothetical protein [Parahaliea mediterranea]MBN7797740.1 hypothetical protein [Parahaliea mediterranea]